MMIAACAWLINNQWSVYLQGWTLSVKQNMPTFTYNMAVDWGHMIFLLMLHLSTNAKAFCRGFTM